MSDDFEVPTPDKRRHKQSRHAVHINSWSYSVSIAFSAPDLTDIGLSDINATSNDALCLQVSEWDCQSMTEDWAERRRLFAGGHTVLRDIAAAAAAATNTTSEYCTTAVAAHLDWSIHSVQASDAVD